MQIIWPWVYLLVGQISWRKRFMTEKTYSEMYSTLSANAHHDVTYFEVDGMILKINLKIKITSVETFWCQNDSQWHS